MSGNNGRQSVQAQTGYYNGKAGEQCQDHTEFGLVLVLAIEIFIEKEVGERQIWKMALPMTTSALRLIIMIKQAPDIIILDEPIIWTFILAKSLLLL